MFSYSLIIYTMVAMSSTYNVTKPEYDWRQLITVTAEKDNVALNMCKDAANKLKINSNKFICVKTK